MASNGKRRVDSRSEYNKQYKYEGNAVRQFEAIPQEEAKKSSKSKDAKKLEPISRAASKNRAKAQKVGKGYVVFLAAVSALSVFVCVEYLQVKAVITSQNKQITTLESKLNELRTDNDAYYNKVLTSVNVEFIKTVAMSRLGMTYPDEDQVYIFDTDGNSYVRQYQNIPDAE